MTSVHTTPGPFRMLALGVALVTGCAAGSGIDGRWEGECLLDSSGTGDKALQLDLRLAQDGDEITGTATVHPDWLMEPVSGGVRGTIADDQVDLSMSPGDAAVSFDLVLEGKLAGEEMSGPCATEIEEGTYTMERTEVDEGVAPG